MAILFGYFINLNITRVLYVNAAMWTLSVEFQFYAAFALVVGVLKLLRCKRQTIIRSVTGITGILYALIVWQRLSVATNGSLLPPINGLIGYMSAYRFDFMLLGILCWSLSARIRIPASLSGTGFYISSFIIISAPIFLTLNNVGNSGGDAELLVVGLAFFILVLLASQDRAFHENGGQTYGFLTWIGDRSYSIYLIHFPVMALQWLVLFMFFQRAFTSDLVYGISQAVLVISVTLVLSHFVYRFIELPCNRWGARLARKIENAMGDHKPATFVSGTSELA